MELHFHGAGCGRDAAARIDRGLLTVGEAWKSRFRSGPDSPRRMTCGWKRISLNVCCTRFFAVEPVHDDLPDAPDSTIWCSGSVLQDWIYRDDPTPLERIAYPVRTTRHAEVRIMTC
jgi:hypothetical protein